MATNLWRIDAAYSGINFWIRHMVISKVRGRFTKYAGTLHLDDGDLTRSVVEATIDASSIDTGTPQRDAHLRSADFFNVEIRRIGHQLRADGKRSYALRGY